MSHGPEALPDITKVSTTYRYLACGNDALLLLFSRRYRFLCSLLSTSRPNTHRRAFSSVASWVRLYLFHVAEHPALIHCSCGGITFVFLPTIRQLSFLFCAAMGISLFWFLGFLSRLKALLDIIRCSYEISKPCMKKWRSTFYFRRYIGFCARSCLSLHFSCAFQSGRLLGTLVFVPRRQGTR